MAIYQLPDGRYRVQVDLGITFDGKRDRRTKVCSSKREARKIEREFELKALKNKGHSDRVTFYDFVVNVWLPEKRQTLRKNTIRGYERDIKLRLIPAFGMMEIPNIKRLHVQQMISRCATKKVATNARETLSSIMSSAVELEIIEHNPARGRFKYPEELTTHKTKEEWLNSFQEHKKFLESVKGDPIEPTVVLGLCFGLRNGEIFGLDWQDVDFDAKTISVRRTYTFSKGTPDLTSPKTENSRRTIPMTDYAYKFLRELYKQRKPIKQTGKIRTLGSPVVVDPRTNERMSPLKANKLMKKFVATHDVSQVTIRTLRHSFATACVKAGVPVKTLSVWLGHTDVTTTLNKYVKPLQSDLRDSADIINDAMNF